MRGNLLGMGGHQRAIGATDEWLTPPSLVRDLGPFDLDPCSPVIRPWDTAAHHLTSEDDGLSCVWSGRVWLNPPYGQETGRWLAKLARHGNGIALIFARTETEMFFKWGWERAHAMLFVRGRISFHKVDGSIRGNAGAPSVLIAYGVENAHVLERCKIVGAFVRLKIGRMA
jgi:hypothetical protein